MGAVLDNPILNAASRGWCADRRDQKLKPIYGRIRAKSKPTMAKIPNKLAR
jgi:hypothetical protein